MRSYSVIMFFCSAIIAVGEPVGSIIAWPAGGVPYGYVYCDGYLASTNQFPELFSVIGYKYGGSGAYFNLPDLRGRFIYGCHDVEYGTDIGNTGGYENVILTVDQMPSHRHVSGMMFNAQTYPYSYIQLGSSYNSLRYVSGQNEPYSPFTSYAGSGRSHSNMPPYMVMNWIIKAVPDVSVVDMGDLYEIQMWDVKVKLWIYGGICALVVSLCFFFRH